MFSLLKYCQQRGAYTGCEFSGPDEDEDLLARLSDLKLDGKAKFLLFFKLIVLHATL